MKKMSPGYSSSASFSYFVKKKQLQPSCEERNERNPSNNVRILTLISTCLWKLLKMQTQKLYNETWMTIVNRNLIKMLCFIRTLDICDFCRSLNWNASKWKVKNVSLERRQTIVSYWLTSLTLKKCKISPIKMTATRDHEKEKERVKFWID